MPETSSAAARNLPHVRLTDASVLISQLEITRREVVESLRDLSEPEREPALIGSAEIGVFCLERAQFSRDTEFVRRRVEGLIADVDKAATPVPRAIEAALSARIGTGEGQVLEPVDRTVKAAEKAVADKLGEVRRLFADEPDPAKETGALGKALRPVRDRLDPKREEIRDALAKMEDAIRPADSPQEAA